MNVTQQSVLLLIKSAVTGQPEKLPENMDFQSVVNLMETQGLTALCYLGALNCGISEEDPIMQYLQDMYCVAVISSERQIELIQNISQAFEENGIDHMPVKGTLMKALYPDHAMRYMCDADILIKEEQYPKIVPIMESLKFREKGESDHEHIWKHPFLMVELHKHLIPSYNKDYYSYFGVGWDLAKIQNGHRWSMTREDAFIYDTIHFAKHYRDASANSHFIIDLWICLRTYPDMDHAYIRQQLGRLKMEAFYDNIIRVTKAWFEGGSWDDVVVRMSEILLAEDKCQQKQRRELAGDTRAIQAEGSAKKARRKHILRRIFFTREQMDWTHPQFKHLPLPIAWVARWCSDIPKWGKAIREEKNKKISEEAVENYRKDLEYVGLQFSDNVALPD